MTVFMNVEYCRCYCQYRSFLGFCCCFPNYDEFSAEFYFDEKDVIFTGSHLLLAAVQFSIDSPDTFQFLADFCFLERIAYYRDIILILTIEF
jgi:hypothetical protein